MADLVAATGLCPCGRDIPGRGRFFANIQDALSRR